MQRQNKQTQEIETLLYQKLYRFFLLLLLQILLNVCKDSNFERIVKYILFFYIKINYNYYSFDNFNNRKSLLQFYISRLIYIQVFFFVDKRD